MRGGSLTCPVLAFFFFFFFSFFIWGVSLRHHVLTLFFCGEFLLHIPCSFSFLFFLFVFPLFFSFKMWSCFVYTSRAGFIFMRGVSLTHPVLALFLSGKFLVHITDCFFLWGVSLTHPMLASLSLSL